MHLDPKNNTTMQSKTDYLFVNCDGPQTKALGQGRKEVNRHVQYNCRRLDPRRWMSATPLPRQIKFRSISQKGNSSCRSKQSLKATIVTKTSPLDLALPLYHWQSSTECNLYDYYAKVVALNVFCDKSSYFWQNYVLQSYHQSPLVKQSLIALSSAFRERVIASERPHYAELQIYDNPAVAFSRAISMLRAYIACDGSPSHTIVVTCAIVLYAYAKVVGDQQAASTHLERAISIFDGWAIQFIGHERPAEFNTIQSVLLLLDLSASIEDKARVPAMTQPGPQLTRFHTLEEIIHSYSVVCQSMMVFTICNYKHILAGPTSCPKEISEERDTIVNNLAQWRAAVDDFLEHRLMTNQPLSLQEQECLSSAMLHWLAGKCQLDEVLPSSPLLVSSWDVHADEWLEHGNRILQIRRQAAMSGSPTATRRSLIISYAQSMLIFAGATSLDEARSSAVAVATEAAVYDQLIRPVDLSHITEGRGHSDALYAMEQQQMSWAPDCTSRSDDEWLHLATRGCFVDS